ncbi:putative transporter [Desulfovibrio sp. SGI.169]|uniref:putative transporter n=1 Tax=Desulfovibrio sp. SGI.169 TaxID=3420561 RepID=UPI003D0520D8
MLWFTQLFTGHGIAQAIIALSLAIVIGLAIGSIPFRGIRLGVGGVLFSSLALAHFGISVDAEVLKFAREFGLILFVFTVGMQVGPGFMDSLRRRGLYLNLAATLNVVLSALVCICLYMALDLPLPVAVGLLSGAVTNTPSLAAASPVFHEIMPEGAEMAMAEAGMGYAVAYPFGIMGIILTMLLVRALFRIQPAQELETLKKLEAIQHPPLQAQTFIVRNPNIFDMPLEDVFKSHSSGVVISRVKEAGEDVIQAPTPKTVLREGMLIHAVGEPKQMETLRTLLGPPSDVDLRQIQSALEVRRIWVTKSSVAGKSVRQLGLTPELGVTITRIIRAGVEFTAQPGTHLYYGDRLFCVGTANDLDRASALLGNSAKALDHPHIMPIFLGISLGVVLGSIPIPLPGLPSGLKLGLAGGPLLVAILLSRINNFARMVWYLPAGANLVLRETGIAIFLACVGLNSGHGFVETLTHGSGLFWMAAGAFITFIPLLTVALLVRIFLRYDYASICGLLAGSMTDPPALAFSVQMLDSDAPSSVYASVYPLTMILRILFAQILVLTLFFLN